MSINHLTNRLQAIIDRALDYGIASSIALGVDFGEDAKIASIDIFAGSTRQFPQQKTSARTIFDVASLTKILGTTVAIAHAMQRGQIYSDERPFSCWPDTTVHQLLAHTSGLPAHVRFYEHLELSSRSWSFNQQEIFSSLFSLIPAKETCRRVYSDVGFMALGILLKQRLKKPLWDIFKDTWRALPIKADFMWFDSKPSCFVNEDHTIAPAGFCRARNNMVVAQAHDPNCYYMGGLAGHAGLFGSLPSVKAMGRFFLKSYLYPHSEIEHLMRGFAEASLGFDTPTRNGTTKYLSPRAFGHFGYTGTSLWIDPFFNQKNG